MFDLSHRIYKRLRPVLSDLGVLAFFRRFISKELRYQIAVKLGLAGFNVGQASGTRMPDWAVERNAAPLEFTGVNLVADLEADFGLSEASRQLCRALLAAEIPVAYTEAAFSHHTRTNALPENLSSGAPYSITVAGVNFDYFYDLVSMAERALAGKYVIGYWTWELPVVEVPASSVALVDEIWVYSRYVQDIFAKVSSVPVKRIPLPVSVENNAILDRQQFGLPEDKFVFLFSFSPASVVARKNPFGVIEAFRRAFEEVNPGAMLAIKCHHMDIADSHNLRAALKENLDSIGGVLIEANLSRLEMNNLLELADCYVSLHRAEGFGLGMAEAMALGKPVIATGYSGNMDYMNESNSFPVRYALRKIIEEDHQFQPRLSSTYQPGQIWAEPDLDHAAELMRYIYENQEQASLVGTKASVDIAQDFSHHAVGKMIRDRLTAITSASHWK